jgi:hypothetical protein
MNEREDLNLVIAMAVTTNYPPIIDLDKDGAITLDTNRLSKEILDAGYRRD